MQHLLTLKVENFWYYCRMVRRVDHRWRFAQLADRIFIAYISAQSISINCYLNKKAPNVLKILKFFL